MAHYDRYGEMAEALVSNIAQNGRYNLQASAEKKIFFDIISKIKPQANDRLLDIGCGLGANLIPLSMLVESATGCDHPKVVERLRSMVNLSNINLIGGNFLDIEFTEKYTKIICYNMLQCLPSKEMLYAIVDKALGLLENDGLMLLGDLVSHGKKSRFLQSNRGRVFQDNWDASMKQNPTPDMLVTSDYSVAHEMDDRFLLDLIYYIRQKGFNAYLMPQPQNLPFGNTREDILITAPEYADA